jgi:hypothetical protein
LESVQSDWSNGDPNKTERRQANRGGHPADLPVAALGDGELEPGGGNGFPEPDGRDSWGQVRGGLDKTDLCRAGWTVVQDDSGSQERERLLFGNAFDLGEIRLREMELRTGELVLQPAHGGQEEQPFAVEIEAAGWIEPGNGDEVLERSP